MIETILLVAVSVVTGVIGVILGMKSYLKPVRKNRELRIEIGDRAIDLSKMNNLDINKILESIEKIQADKQENADAHRRQAGYVSVEALLLIVPGIIALMFAGTFIYLLIANQGNPNYSTPKELTAAMTTIIGYYFGIGASTAIRKSKTITPEDFKKLISQGN